MLIVQEPSHIPWGSCKPAPAAAVGSAGTCGEAGRERAAAPSSPGWGLRQTLPCPPVDAGVLEAGLAPGCAQCCFACAGAGKSPRMGRGGLAGVAGLGCTGISGVASLGVSGQGLPAPGCPSAGLGWPKAVAASVGALLGVGGRDGADWVVVMDTESWLGCWGMYPASHLGTPAVLSCQSPWPVALQTLASAHLPAAPAAG